MDNIPAAHFGTAVITHILRGLRKAVRLSPQLPLLISADDPARLLFDLSADISDFCGEAYISNPVRCEVRVLDSLENADGTIDYVVDSLDGISVGITVMVIRSS